MKFPRSNVCNATQSVRSDPISPVASSHRDSFELYLTFMAHLISTLALLAPSSSFLRVLARRVIVPYLAAAGRTDADAVTFFLSLPYLRKSHTPRFQYHC